MNEPLSTASLLVEHARLMNLYGPGSPMVQRLLALAEHSQDKEFIQLAAVAHALKVAWARKMNEAK